MTRAMLHTPYCWLPSCSKELRTGPSRGRTPAFCRPEHKARYNNDVRDIRGLLAVLDEELRRPADQRRKAVTIEREIAQVRHVLDGYPVAGSRGRLGENMTA